jgi:hypothetical protein
MVPGIRRIARDDIPRLMAGYDQVWRW